MAFNSIYMIYGVIFLAALLLVEGLYHFFADSRGSRDAVNRRMKMLGDGATSSEVFHTLRRKPRNESSSSNPFTDFGGKLDHLIEQSGLTVNIVSFPSENSLISNNPVPKQ